MPLTSPTAAASLTDVCPNFGPTVGRTSGSSSRSTACSSSRPSAGSATRIASLSLPDLRCVALPATFAWYGLLMGSWAGRLPAIKDALQLTHTQLAMVLLCTGIGAVLSPQLSSRLLARLGSLPTLRMAGLALPLVMMAAAAAPGLSMLMLATLALGLTASTFDVAMNGLASRVEHAQRRPMLSRLHACACGGGLAGVTLGSAMAAMQVSPVQQLALLALPLAGLLWQCLRILDTLGHGAADGAADCAIDAPPHSQRLPLFVLPRGRLALLGALGLLGAIAEGSIGSWSSLFLKEHHGASEAMAPLSLSAFTLMMLISRCCGDRLKARFGAQRLVCSGAATAALGLGIAVCAPGVVLALAGFALAGLGLSLVFPFVYSAAGRESKTALAGVATMAYAGSLMGPPLMGAIAEGLGLQATMAGIGLLAGGMALVARRAQLLK